MLGFRGEASASQAMHFAPFAMPLPSRRLHTEFPTVRKPAWLVLLKLLGVAAMVGVGYAITLPALWELAGLPLWECIAIIAGAMLLYIGVAFFVRPEPSSDALGEPNALPEALLARSATSRWLRKPLCLFAPGRFSAEALIDLCVLLRLVRGAEAGGQAASGAATGGNSAARPAAEFSLDPTRPIAPLDPNRFALSSANYVAGQIQLDTQRFTTPPKQS
jgi:hypothetical protein